MERRVSDKTILDKFVEDFVNVVEKHCRYIIVSGFVAIAHGRSRGTEDIDMIIERLDKMSFINMHNELVKKGFVCIQSDSPDEIYDNYLMRNISVRYTEGKDFFPPEMEVKFARDEIDEYQLKTRVKLPFTGLDVWFSSIEMNIAFKEEYLRSEKDMEDAKHLRIIYGEKISESEIAKIKGQIKKIRGKK